MLDEESALRVRGKKEVEGEEEKENVEVATEFAEVVNEVGS